MLEAVVVGALIAAGASVIYAFIALFREKELRETAKEINTAAKEAAKKASDNAEAAATAGAAAGAGALSQATTQQAGVVAGLSSHLEALAKFAEALSKLKQGLAALLVALAFLMLAAVAAGIEDKVDDKKKDKSAATSGTAPAARTYLQCLDKTGSKYAARRRPTRCAHFARPGDFNSGVYLKKVRWSRWNRGSARGRGIDCGLRVPCKRTKVRLRAFGRKKACGRFVYSRLKVSGPTRKETYRTARCARLS